MTVPAALRELVRRETFAPDVRATAGHWLRVADAFAQDPLSCRLAASLKAHQGQIEELIRRVGDLAGVLVAEPPELVLCHSDIHAANLLVDDRSGELYIVDWDDPILAPKERAKASGR